MWKQCPSSRHAHYLGHSLQSHMTALSMWWGCHWCNIFDRQLCFSLVGCEYYEPPPSCGEDERNCAFVSIWHWMRVEVQRQRFLWIVCDMSFVLMSQNVFQIEQNRTTSDSFAIKICQHISVRSVHFLPACWLRVTSVACSCFLPVLWLQARNFSWQHTVVGFVCVCVCVCLCCVFSRSQWIARGVKCATCNGHVFFEFVGPWGHFVWFVIWCVVVWSWCGIVLAGCSRRLVWIWELRVCLCENCTTVRFE